ncbi:MAG: hypothetical protein JWO03_2048 [Bacteroidetes bacterium]|nr:hypothetical protein [Bacteroidota bacterium]
MGEFLLSKSSMVFISVPISIINKIENPSGVLYRIVEINLFKFLNRFDQAQTSRSLMN